MSGRQVIPARGLQAQRCRCGTAVLAGLTASGLQVALDRAPLSTTGELMAVLAGVWTYTHHHVLNTAHVRMARTINERPAGTRPRQSVHPVHQCGTTWPALPRPPAPAAADPDAAPPY